MDDDDAVRSALAELLRYLGCEVVEARAGLQAIQLAQRHGTHLRAALIDAHLPGISGREVCGRLKSLLPELPLVLITGYECTDDLTSTGARYLVEKPFGIKTLSQLLRRMGIPLHDHRIAA